MASPADREAEARADLERITAALYREFQTAGGNARARLEDAGDRVQTQWRTAVRMLVVRDVIRVGKRPERAPAPLKGQVSFDA